MVSQIVLLLYIQKQKGVFQNMKKQKITTLLLTMVLCASAVLSGCAASQTEPNQSTTSSTPFEEAKDSGTPISSDEASSVQAYENDEVLSSEEQAKAEQERRAEIAEKYSIYEPYGMTYDTEKDRFFYNGQVVRYFKDQINSNETNGFSYCSATSFLRNWDSILEKKRANLRSISEPARLRQPPPRSTGSAHARGRAQSIREERRIAAPPVLFALLWVRLLSALYGPFCGPLRPFGGCPRGVTPPP